MGTVTHVIPGVDLDVRSSYRFVITQAHEGRIKRRRALTQQPYLMGGEWTLVNSTIPYVVTMAVCAIILPSVPVSRDRTGAGRDCRTATTIELRFHAIGGVHKSVSALNDLWSALTGRRSAD